jgi:hypothetical protein
MATRIIVNAKELRKLTRTLTQAEIEKGMRRAISRAIQSGRTQASQGVRRQYELPVKYVNSKLPIKVRGLRATLQGETRGTPLSMFNPTEVRVNSRRPVDFAGVYLTIKKGGPSVQIRSAWLGTVRKGTQGERYGVFARGRYAKGDFAFRKKREQRTGPDNPINQLRTTSPYVAATQQSVMQKVQGKARETYDKRLLHEIQQLYRKSVTSAI